MKLLLGIEVHVGLVSLRSPERARLASLAGAGSSRFARRSGKDVAIAPTLRSGFEKSP